MSTDIHTYVYYLHGQNGGWNSFGCNESDGNIICRQFFGTILVARTSSQKLQFFFFVMQLCFVVDYPKVSSWKETTNVFAIFASKMSFLYYNLQLVTIIKSNIMVAKIFIYLQKFSMRVDEKKNPPYFSNEWNIE